MPGIFRRYERRWNAWLLPSGIVLTAGVWRQQGAATAVAAVAGGCLLIVLISHPAPKTDPTLEDRDPKTGA